MQSDGNIFGGDVISDIFNKTFRDEENITYQILKCKYVRIIIIIILFFFIREAAKKKVLFLVVTKAFTPPPA